MYYSSGNYEAFATPKKPEVIDNNSAYVVFIGLAGLGSGLLPDPRCADARRAHHAL